MCSQFPSQSGGHQLLVSVISVACSMPIVIFLEWAFETSNEARVPEVWLTWTIWRRMLLGDTRWSYIAEKPDYVRRTVAQHANELDKLLLEVWAVDAIRWLAALPLRAARACGRALGCIGKVTPEDHAVVATENPLARSSGESASIDTEAVIDERLAEARRTARFGRRVGWLGIAAVYTCWAFFAWIIFVRAPRRSRALLAAPC